MKRALHLLVVAAAGIVIGFCLAVIFYRPTVQVLDVPRPPPIIDPSAATSTPPVTVAQLAIEDQADHWARRAFIEMVPPIRLPTDGTEADIIRVWLRVPDNGKITVRTVDGQPSLRFPPGSTADRVESLIVDGGESVVDVRGTNLVDGGEMWHVYVPTSDSVTASLIGWEWKRDDGVAQDAATGLLTRHLAQTRSLQDRRMPRSSLIDSYRKNNDCGRCHVYNKDENLRSPMAIHRRTDDNGWYVPLSVLSDTMPLEVHRPRDMNANDPFISLECPTGHAPTLDENEAGGRRYKCENGGVPVGTLDVKAAMAKHDAHAIALCRSRKYLWDHFEPDARKAFAAVFSECGL